MASDTHPKTLRDYFTLQRGTTYQSRLLGQTGPVLLGLATIQRNGGFRSDSLRTYGGDSPNNLLVQPGDLYASLKDVTQSADLLGAVARLPAGHSPGRLTQDTVKLEPKFEDVPIDYIYWLLRTPQCRTYCRAHATGTTNLGLARDDFLALLVPELNATRRSIVKALTALDDKIELNRWMNETLEGMARALFKSWFVDFDPVRAKMEGRDPDLPKHIADLFPDLFVDSELGEIPEGWEVKTLRECMNLTMGQSPPGSTYNEHGEGVPFFQGRSDFGFRYPENRKFCTAPTRIAQPGDTLVSVRAPVGDINMAWEKCCIGRGVAALRHKSGSVSFSYYFTWTIQAVLREYEHTGTVFGAINKSQFEAFRVIEPDFNIVDAFDSCARPLDARVRSNIAESRTLAALRDALLPKLISGELRVNDAGMFFAGPS